MAVEEKRGCGYRKVGGTYLVCEGTGFSCGRIPAPIVPCPLCDHRPAFTRGLQKITPRNFLHAAPACRKARDPEEPYGRCAGCPFERALDAEEAGLMWVGAAHYTPDEFRAEAARLGVSKRVHHVPAWFKPGMWVYLAHEQTFTDECPACKGHKTMVVAAGSTDLFEDCHECQGEGTIHRPGVFFAFQPSRVERIVTDYQPAREIPQDEIAGPEGGTIPNPAHLAWAEERAWLEYNGFTLVEVPAADPDHGGKPREEG